MSLFQLLYCFSLVCVAMSLKLLLFFQGMMCGRSKLKDCRMIIIDFYCFNHWDDEALGFLCVKYYLTSILLAGILLITGSFHDWKNKF